MPTEDVWANARANAKPDRPKCHGTGKWKYDHNHATICDICCQHNMGWWQLREHYGKDNDKWCCRAGCGHTREANPDGGRPQ